MNIFKKKNTQKPMSRDIPENHVSKKKKNTYTIVFSVFVPINLFSLCKESPLGLATVNGKQESFGYGWTKCKTFPNPAAIDMANNYPLFREIMGEKLSTTIIEYLDKDTGAPVLQVYPHMVHIFDGYENDYIAHLNHASRRDFERQLALRKKVFEQPIQNNR